MLTLERVRGIPSDERAALITANFDPDGILARAAVIFFKQVFRDGFFHGDMHPGNIFIDENGDLVPVDFGIMGRLDGRTRRYLGEMLLGFLSADYQRVADVHFAAGYVPKTQDKAAFMQACRAIAEPIRGRPLAAISIGRLLGQLFEVSEAFAMETQPQLLLLQKTMVVAEGVGRALNPNINMWQLAQPLIEAWMARESGSAGSAENGSGRRPGDGASPVPSDRARRAHAGRHGRRRHQPASADGRRIAGTPQPRHGRRATLGSVPDPGRHGARLAAPMTPKSREA